MKIKKEFLDKNFTTHDHSLFCYDNSPSVTRDHMNIRFKNITARAVEAHSEPKDPLIKVDIWVSIEDLIEIKRTIDLFIHEALEPDGNDEDEA